MLFRELFFYRETSYRLFVRDPLNRVFPNGNSLVALHMHVLNSTFLLGGGGTRRIGLPTLEITNSSNFIENNFVSRGNKRETPTKDFWTLDSVGSLSSDIACPDPTSWATLCLPILMPATPWGSIFSPWALRAQNLKFQKPVLVHSSFNLHVFLDPRDGTNLVSKLEVCSSMARGQFGEARFH